jgi:polar amino acid transport system substrate-binding protein
LRLRVLISMQFAVVLVLTVAAGSSSARTTVSGAAARPAHAGAGSLPLPPKVNSIASEVPSSLQSKQPWQLATDANGNAPGEYIDPKSGVMKGSDIDVGYALCAVMGVTCKWNQVTFDSLIVQLKAGKYAFSIAGMTPRPEREKSIDFITYYQAGEVWITTKNGPSMKSALDMCGKRLATTSGIIEEADAWGFMGMKPGGTPIPGAVNHCKAAGKPDIKVLSFPSEPQADTTLLSGRSDVVWTDQGVANWVVKNSHGKLKVAGKACSVGRYGIALPKHSPLIKPISDALKYLIKNGYYLKIHKYWGNANGAVKVSDVKLNDNSTVGPSCVPKY